MAKATMATRKEVITRNKGKYKKAKKKGKGAILDSIVWPQDSAVAGQSIF